MQLALFDRDLFDQHRLFRVSAGVPSLSIRSTTSKPLSTLPTRAYSGGSPASARGDDVELAAGAAGRLGRALRHRHDPLGVGEVRRRLLVDAVAGPADAGAERVAALDHEAGRDAVEGEVVVEALVGEEDEGVDRLRRPLESSAISKSPQLVSPPRSAFRPSSPSAGGALRLTFFGAGASTSLQPPLPLAVVEVVARCPRCGRSGSPRRPRPRPRAKPARMNKRRSVPCSIGAEA